MPDQNLHTEALAGPWTAVLADLNGHVTDLDDVRGWHPSELDEVSISIVRRSATPTGPDSDGDRKLPGTYNGGDLLIEWAGFEDHDEVEARLVQAEAMVAGLNAAAS